jgi:polyhydroxyalkanoate synthesis regulator phasin
MAPNDGLRRYLEAGLALTQITRARAEELVHELIQAGEVETTRAQDWVEGLVKASRDRSDTLLSTVRGEVLNQLSDLGITNMDLLDKAETAARRATSRGPGRGRTTTRATARTTKAKKAPARKAPAKKTTAKSAPAKKSAARTTKAKKAPARKAPAKKTTAAAGKKTASRSASAAKARP